MWPFDMKGEPTPTPAPMHQPLERTVSVEEVLIARLIHQEQRIQGLEQAVVMLSEAFKQLANNQNQNFLAIQTQFQQLVAYVMRPRASIVQGEFKDKN